MCRKAATIVCKKCREVYCNDECFHKKHEQKHLPFHIPSTIKSVKSMFDEILKK